MDIFVINLDRRPDRLEAIASSLETARLPFTRISAVDATDPAHGIDDRLTQRPFGAIWQSHVRAYESLVQTQSQYALVLEDDALLSPSTDWNLLSASIPQGMAGAKLDYLQIGFLTSQYKPRKMPNWLDRARQPHGDQRIHVVLGNEPTPVILWSSRSGSHAYVISRRLANVVRNFNQPPWLAPDGFFDYLSQAQRVFGLHKMGRLATSLVDQVSRTSGSRFIDSDAVI